MIKINKELQEKIIKRFIIWLIIFLLGIMLFPDIFFYKICYIKTPIGEKIRINCSMIYENNTLKEQRFYNQKINTSNIKNINIKK